MTPSRPRSVAAIAWLLIAAGALAFVGGAVFFALILWTVDEPDWLRSEGFDAFDAVGMTIGAAIAAGGLAAAQTGRMLLRERRAAWWVTMLAATGFALYCGGALLVYAMDEDTRALDAARGIVTEWVIPAALGLALSIAILGALARPRIRRRFTR